MNNLIYRWTSPQISEEAKKLLETTIKSGQWSYGPISRQVEREITVRLGGHGALLTNSGTAALWILLSMARQEGQEQAIILPAFGYSAAANVASALGYEIYIADSSPDSPVVDPESVKRLIDDKVTFIIGINYFGYSVAWDKIPRDKKFTIIEDSAGSFGAKYKDQPCGSNAELAIVSFHTSKAAAAGGEGGCILASDSDILRKAKAVGKNGHVKGYYYSEMSGMNMLMTDVAACFLRDTMRQFEEMGNKRRRTVDAIDSILKSTGAKTAEFNHSTKERAQNYQTYAMLVDNRDLVVELLRANGFEVRPCWPYLITELPATRSAVKKVDGTLANAKRFAQRIINIPVNPLLAESQLEKLSVALPKLLSIKANR